MYEGEGQREESSYVEMEEIEDCTAFPIEYKARYVPADVRRRLRQEGCFCCSVCGSPVLEYHHIEPWSETKAHRIEEMIALCPTCHALADNGSYSRSYLYSLKKPGGTPPGWQHSLRFKGNDVAVKVGPTRFLEKPRNCLIRMCNIPILSVRRSESQNVVFNTCFYDETGQPILEIRDNELVVESRSFWDIEYNGHTLRIRKKPRQVVLEVEITSDVLWFKRGVYSLGGAYFEFTENRGKIESGDATVLLGNTRVGTFIIHGPQERTMELPSGFRTARRNDLCHCGSGKKFKKCCGSNL